MSKASLDESQNKIPEVDGSLEEDSVVIGDSAAMQALKTEESHPDIGVSELSSPPIQKGEALSTGQLAYSLHQEEHQSEEHHPFQQSLEASGLNVSMLNSEIKVEMSEDIAQYFRQIGREEGESQNNKKKWIQEATHKVKKQIKKGEIGVSEKQRELHYEENGKPISQKRTIEQLQLKKYQAKQELRSIDVEQTRLRAHKKALTDRPKVKIQLTKEDKRKLIELIKVKREFQRSLERKNQELREEAKHKRIEEDERIKAYFLLENKKKQEKILKRMKELELHFQERQEGLKQSVLRRREKYAYKKIEEEWSLGKKEEERENERKIQQLHDRHKLNIEQIRLHEKRYSQQLEKRLEEQNTKSRVVNHTTPQRDKTQFDKIIEQELFQLKESNYKKVIKAMEHEFRDKINQFQNKVKSNYMPRVDPEKAFVSPLSRAYSSLCLSKEQRNEKGLQYLAKAKELKKSESVVQVRVAPGPQIYGNKVYKNYLEKGDKKRVNPLKKQFKQLLEGQDQVSDYEKIVRAKNLADGLVAITKKRGDNKLYYSMKTKLEILENLY